MVLALVVAASLVSVDSALAWGKKKKKKQATQEKFQKAVNLHKYPDMVFKRGLLKQDVYGNWNLGDTPLAFGRNSRITSDDPDRKQGRLVEGREAVVVGHLTGGALVIHRATVLGSDEMMNLGSYSTGSRGTEEDVETRNESVPQ